MAKLIQIILVIALQWFRASPFLFQDINIKRSFDISIKPLSLKPLTFITEKWSPLGVFGRKHAILRRDLESIQSSITEPHASFSIDKHTLLVPPIKDEKSHIYVPKLSQEAANAISITPELIPAPVSEEIEPITVAPLYIKPLTKPAVPQKADDTEKDLQQVSKPQMSPESEAISKLGTVIMPTDFEGIIRPILHFPSLNAKIPPSLSVSHSTVQSMPSPILLPQESEIQIMGSLPDLEQEPIISNTPSPLPPPPPRILQNEPVLIKNHYAPVVITPLPPVSMIIPPAVVESPATSSQHAPIEIKRFSIPGSVLLSPEPGPILTSVPTTILEDNAPVSVEPPIGASPALQTENGFPNLLTNIFKPTSGLTSNQIDVPSPPEINSVIETPKIPKENVFIRGSKMVLRFGNVIFKLMSQFFNDARVTLDQLTSTPPVYQN